VRLALRGKRNPDLICGSPPGSGAASSPNPRNSGLSHKRGADSLSKFFAGPGEARPALEETRYFPPFVARGRRWQVTPGPAVRETRSPALTVVGTCFGDSAVFAYRDESGWASTSRESIARPSAWLSSFRLDQPTRQLLLRLTVAFARLQQLTAGMPIPWREPRVSAAMVDQRCCRVGRRGRRAGMSRR